MISVFKELHIDLEFTVIITDDLLYDRQNYYVKKW